MQVSKYFTSPASYPPWCPKGESYLLFACFYIHFEQSLTRKVPNLQIFLPKNYTLTQSLPYNSVFGTLSWILVQLASGPWTV